MIKIFVLIMPLFFSSIATAIENVALYDPEKKSLLIFDLSIQGNSNKFSAILQRQNSGNLIFNILHVTAFPSSTNDPSTNDPTYDQKTGAVIIPSLMVLASSDKRYSVELQQIGETVFGVTQIIDKATGALEFQTIKSADLHGMIHKQGELRYDTFSGLWKLRGESTWLLLKNGWAMKNPDIPPTLINFESSLVQYPKKWREWREDDYFKNESLYQPSPKGAGYQLSVERTSNFGNTANTHTETKYIKLMEDSRFEIKKVSSPSIGDYDKSGTYFIEGHTIELRFDSGEITQSVFATDGKGNIIFGTEYY